MPSGAGRPREYPTNELEEQLFELLEQGHTLSGACIIIAGRGAPGEALRRKITNWLRDGSMLGDDGTPKHPILSPFLDMYAQVRAIATERRFDAIRETTRQALEEVRACDPKQANAIASAYRLIIDAEKWCLARESPRKYGDASTVKLLGDEDEPLEVLWKIKG